MAQQPYNQNGLWGLKKGHTWLLEPKYDLISPQQSGHFIVKKDKLYGLLDPSGKLILETTYSSLYMPDKSHVVFAEGGQLNVIQGELVDGKYGLMNASGQILIPAQFHRIYMSNGLLNVQVNDNWGHWGILDVKGKVLLDTIYPSFSFDMRPHSPISILDKSYVMIKEGDFRWKFLNVHTKRSRTIEYNDFWGPVFSGEHAVLHSKNMVIDMSGKRISKPGLKQFYLFEEGHFLARNNEGSNWELYNAIGQKLKEIEQLDHVINFKQKYGLVKVKDGRYGVINSLGELSYMSTDTLKSTASDGFFIQKKGRLNHILNHDGRKLGQSMSLEITDYYHDFKVLSVRGQKAYGQILYDGRQGQKLVALEIRYVRAYGKYLYCESYGEARFYINRNTEVLGTFDPRYEFERDWKNKWGIKNVTSGDWILSPNYQVRNQINDSTFHLMDKRFLSSSDSVLIISKKNGGFRFEACDVVSWKNMGSNKKNYLLNHNGLHGIMNNNYQLIIPFIGDSAELGYQSHKVFIGGDNYIYSDQGTRIAKNQVLHKTYKYHYHIKDTVAQVDKLISKDGQIVFSGDFRIFQPLKNDALSLFDVANKAYYLITPKATHAVQMKYRPTAFISPDVVGGEGAYICTNGKSDYSSRFRLGLVLPDGKLLIEPKKYSSSNQGKEPFLILFGRKNDLVIRDIQSQPIGKTYKNIDVLYHVRRINGQLQSAYAVGQKGAYQIYSDDFSPINEFVYQYIEGFGSKNFLVKKDDGKFYLIDESGKDLIGKSFEEADSYDDMIAFKDMGGKYHMYNSNGNLIVQDLIDGYKFDDYYASTGMVEVIKDNMAYIYYENGELIAGPVDEFFHLDFDYFDEAYIGARKDGKVNLLSLYGSESMVFKEYYDDIKYVEADEMAAIVKKNGKYGLIDLDDKVLVEIHYDSIELFEVEDDEGYIGIVKKGDEQWHLTYEFTLVP